MRPRACDVDASHSLYSITSNSSLYLVVLSTSTSVDLSSADGDFVRHTPLFTLPSCQALLLCLPLLSHLCLAIWCHNQQQHDAIHVLCLFTHFSSKSQRQWILSGSIGLCEATTTMLLIIQQGTYYYYYYAYLHGL